MKEITNCKQKDADYIKDLVNCGEINKYFICTRPKGHKGNHHAHGLSGHCYGIWKQKTKRSKKSINLDRKKIALSQKHEVAYLQRLCSEQLKILKQLDGTYLVGNSPDPFQKQCSRKKLIRITKALEKCLRRIK